MIKVLAIYRNDKPLAEIRTDGKRYEVFDDQTNGLAEKLGGGDYARLLKRLRSSSYLQLRPKRDGVPGVLRYLLDSGSVVEITTDGKSALLNGNLLDENAKNKMMGDIANGVVTVVQKQDVSKPTPINLTMRSPEAAPDLTSEQQVALYASCNDAARKTAEKYDEGSSYHDERIESMDTTDLEWPERTKNMAYFLKHGKFKGE